MESILNLSKRTISKIVHRLELSCSNCGWSECTCDIHHIIHRSKGGTDDHNNLTYLCPNCHRMAHNDKIEKFITLTEHIGDSWKSVYFPEKAGFPRLELTETQLEEKKANLEKARLSREIKYKDRTKEKINILLNCDIDYTKRGWVKEVSEKIGISSQKISKWMERHMPDTYKICNKRKVMDLVPCIR